MRFKARLVAKGYSQREGIDFKEIFSPVVKHTSIRVILALVAASNLELKQMDVKSAFLHGHLEETIYMSQPKGHVVPRKEHVVYLLQRSLYGLKQSPRQWYKRFESFVISKGFNRSSYDCCVYFKKEGSINFIYLLLYVDDMLIASSDMNAINSLKKSLNSEFEMKDLGAAKRILGMEIDRDWSMGLLHVKQSNSRKIT